MFYGVSSDACSFWRYTLFFDIILCMNHCIARWFNICMRALFWVQFCTILFSLTSTWPSSVHAKRWGRWDLRLRLDLSMGYDDNVRRVALPPEPSIHVKWKGGSLPKSPVTSPLPPANILGDGVHQVELRTRLGYRDKVHLGWLRYTLGWKRFFLVHGEDAIVQEAQAVYYARLHRRILLGGQWTATDLRRVNQSREFSQMRGLLLLHWLAPKGWRLTLQGGYGGFLFRHLEAFDAAKIEGFTHQERYSNHGDTYGVVLRKRFHRVFRMWGSYRFARQFFAVQRSHNDKKVCSVSSRAQRADLQHLAGLGLRMLYRVLLDASYRLVVHHAGACNESYLGHQLLLRLGIRPFWKLYFVTELNVQFRVFLDGAPFNPSLTSTQEDSLTTLTFRLSRPILKHLHANIRYSYFANWFGTGINQYERHLFLLGLSFRY